MPINHTEVLLKAFFESEKRELFLVRKESIRRGRDFTQLFISDNSSFPELKVDIVNDVAPHFSEFEVHKVLGKIDSWRNILSNKITALFRSEPKDIADLLTISEYERFNPSEADKS